MPTGITLSQFWSWTASDLLSNTLRGHLAEFLVATALGCAQGVRTEWDDVDLRLPDGTAIEVKSSAYAQSWKQSRPSIIRFAIAPTQGWDAETNDYTTHVARRADVYVFCLLGAPSETEADPLDLSQWTFYVLSKAILDARVPTQRTIGLGPLVALGAARCGYSELAGTVQRVAAQQP